MDAEAAYRLLRSVAAEVVSEDELKALCQDAAAGKHPKAYIGFEPSGTAHIGWMVCTDAIRRLVESGFDVTVLLADWHAQINDKLGGDLLAIQRCGKYMEEAFEALGIAKGSVTYRYASEFAKDPAYWAMVVKVAKASSLARIRRAMTIMGRAEDESDGDLSKFLYPAMQVADIFHMQVRLAMGGMDQRHAHMLARDVAPKLQQRAPVALHTPLVPSLKGVGRMDIPITRAATVDLSKAMHLVEPTNKMSKSDPDSGIFIHDSREDIMRKLKGAHCPPKELEGNPVLDLLRLVVFPRIAAAGGALRVTRPERFGGNKTYSAFEEVAGDYAAGTLHPMDLKAAVGDALDQELAPVRAYFANHPDNWQFIQGLRKTR